MVVDIRPPIGVVVTLVRISCGVDSLIPAWASAQWGPGSKPLDCSDTAFLYSFFSQIKKK